MKHSDWLLIVMWLGAANQIALFQHSTAQKFVFDMGSEVAKRSA